jgi:hypothetical protein
VYSRKQFVWLRWPNCTHNTNGIESSWCQEYERNESVLFCTGRSLVGVNLVSFWYGVYKNIILNVCIYIYVCLKAMWSCLSTVWNTCLFSLVRVNDKNPNELLKNLHSWFELSVKCCRSRLMAGSWSSVLSKSSLNIFDFRKLLCKLFWTYLIYISRACTYLSPASECIFMFLFQIKSNQTISIHKFYWIK